MRLGTEHRICCLFMVGARLDGKKELIVVQDDCWASKESWAEQLRDLKKRGMRSPVLTVGDRALEFWAAVRDVFPRSATSATGCLTRQRARSSAKERAW